MGEIVWKFIKDSFVDVFYLWVVENLGVMREELFGFEMLMLYNKFLRVLKKSLLSGELDGDWREMWYKYIVGGGLGFIMKEELDVLDVIEEEVKVVSIWFFYFE